jgi:hypothetical protein
MDQDFRKLVRHHEDAFQIAGKVLGVPMRPPRHDGGLRRYANAVIDLTRSHRIQHNSRNNG